MRRIAMTATLGLGLVLGTAASALAAPGFATGNVNLRAGPGTAYPQVVVVPGGAPIEIFGCLQGYGWCDVGFNGVRGWVSSGYLQYSYEGRRVPFARYTGQAGVPVVTFQFGNYWGDHYRDRPWFAERDRWGRGPGPGYGPAGGRGPGWDRDREPGWERDRGPGWDRDRPHGWDRDRDHDRGDRGDRGYSDRGPGPGPGRGPDRGPGFDRGPGGPGPGPGPGGPGPGPGGPGGPGGPDRGPPDGFRR